MNTTTQPVPQQTGQAAQNAPERVAVPVVDVLEDEQGITLYADLPGVPREGLDVKVEGDSLTIEGRVALPVSEGLSPLYAEVRTARFRRAFTLSRELDTRQIDAQLKDGVLRLRVNKHEQAQPRRIQVQVN